MGEVFASFATAMGAGIMMVLRRAGAAVRQCSCSRSPSSSRCRCRSAAPSPALCHHRQCRSALPVVIGILMLMGIVTKNAIMLVDFAVEEMRARRAAHRGDHRCRPQARAPDRHDHHRHDRPACCRSALALGDGGEFRAPMAIAVIGGLLVSTVLSLVFVPAVFTVMDDIGRLAWRVFSRFVGGYRRTRHGQAAAGRAAAMAGWRRNRLERGELSASAPGGREK